MWMIAMDDQAVRGRAESPAAVSQERLAYSPGELAEAFGLSRKAIYRAIETGELRAARVCRGSRLLVPASEASEWIERNLTPPKEARRAPPVELGVRRGQRTPLRDALGGASGGR